MYILKLNPVFKDYLWGGTKLRDEYGFKSDLTKLAEGWMLSCHKDGENTIENGEFAGKTLTEVVKSNPDFLGENGKKFEYFPILIKLIDAKDDLSVQVHPDNEYAMRVENEYGKTECWYILDCDEGAELIYGFNREISSKEFKNRIADNTFLETVNKVKVKKGDLFFIEAGTLHAIGKGILLAEIQQNSNTTYRVYDYGRLGADGKPRDLHVEKAIDVTNCTPPTRSTNPEGELVEYEDYFQIINALLNEEIDYAFLPENYNDIYNAGSSEEGIINTKLATIKAVNFGGTKQVFDISFKLHTAVIT